MIAQSPRILIVDDEPYIVKTLTDILAHQDYEIFTASGGKEAISFLKKLEIDLCVLDLIMPGVSGQDVMQFIKSMQIDTDVVVLSGDTHINAAINALNHRAVGFLKKPFNPQELLQTVADALRHKHLVSQKKHINAKIKKSERMHRYLSNNSPDLIYLLNSQGEFLYLNDRIESLLGYKKNELIGKHFTDIVYQEDLPKAQFTFNERRQGDRATRNLQIRLQEKSGQIDSNPDDFQFVDIELNSIGVYSEHQIGTASQHGTLGVIREVSQRVSGGGIERVDGHHDRLTGLPNRWLLNDRLNLALNQARRQGHMLIIMFIDLDGFKKINDTVGHRTGDKVLQQYTERLRCGLRKGDTLARYGGDEFVLMLPHIESLEQVKVIAKKILDTTAQRFQIEDVDYSVTASIGISVFPDDGDTQEALIDRADSAMYRVKNMSKNGFFFYSDLKVPDQPDTIREQFLQALEQCQLMVFYQPIFDLSSQTIIGFEALLRWQHPEKGLLFPGEFLPLVKQLKLMQTVDDWVLDTVCKDFSDVIQSVTENVRISVNVSAEKLAEPDFVEWMHHVLLANHFPIEHLQIEICSRMLSGADEQVLQNLNLISRSGVRILIENFDGEELSLVQLSGIAIDGIKMDSVQLNQIPDSQNLAAEKTLLATARNLGLDLIAKNIDSDQGLVRCKSMDVSSVQGFLYQHPLPVEDAKRLLEI